MEDIPAFPTEYWDKKMGLEYNHPGMTLRDYFAGQALCGMLPYTARHKPKAEECAIISYAIADSMLTQRQKERGF